MGQMIAALVLTIGMAGSGCMSQNDPRLKKIEETEKAVGKLSEQLAASKSQLDELSLSIGLLKMTTESYKSATFDPGNPGGYMRIDTTGGLFLVAFKNAVPYVDGFRVTLNFGNPSAATFKGFKLKAKWGARFDPTNKAMTYPQWAASLREKELSLTDSLNSASWNPVTFVLSPAAPDAFGYLELSMDTDTVNLRK